MGVCNRNRWWILLFFSITKHLYPIWNHFSFYTIILITFHDQFKHYQFYRPQRNSLPATRYICIILNNCHISFILLYLHTDEFNFSQLVSHLTSFLIFPHGLYCFPSKSQLCVQNKLCDNIEPRYNCRQEPLLPKMIKKSFSYRYILTLLSFIYSVSSRVSLNVFTLENNCSIWEKDLGF